jgi:diadenosine tetraphosphate (Ap4A) HIT family hydrolase
LGSSSANCKCCEIASSLATANGAIFDLGRHWTLNRNVDANRPSLVLQARRHVAHIAELTAAETDDLARLLPAIDDAMRAQVGAERTHVLLLAEASPHVHWHLVPRFREDEHGVVGLQLLSVEPPVPEVPGLVEAVADAARQDSRVTGRSQEPSPIVRRVVAGLDRCQKLMPYDPLLRRWRGPLPRDPEAPPFRPAIERTLARAGQPSGERSSADAATVYVGLWLVVLIGLALFSVLWPNGLAVELLASLAALRAFDVATFQLRVLLDRRASLLASFERTLLFLGVNLLEMALALAVLLIAWAGIAPDQAFRDAFGIVTLTDAPAFASDVAFALRVAFTAISIVLLAGAGAVVLGLVGRDVDEAPHESKPPGIASDDA